MHAHARQAQCGHEPVNQLFRNHYGTGPNPGHLRRFRDFCNQRYEGNTDVVKAAATQMLEGLLSDSVLQVFRQSLFHYYGTNILVPNAIPDEKLDPVVAGYADQFQKITGQENAQSGAFMAARR